jgi:hypothetical protein
MIFSGRSRYFFFPFILPCNTHIVSIFKLLLTVLYFPKDDENAKAVALLGGVIAQADAVEDIGARIEHLIKGVFSGNIFDLGAAQVLTDFIFLCCGI